MAFFDDNTVENVAERHIAAIEALEEREAKALLASYRHIRRELRDKLDVLDPGSFTAQRTRGVLFQIETALLEMKEALKVGISQSSAEAAKKGIEHLLTEIKAFEKHFTGAVIEIPVDHAAIMLDTRNFLLNRHEASIDAYSEDLRKNIALQISNAAIEEITVSELVGKVGRFFLGEEWRLHRIARTELHNVYGLAKLGGMKEAQDTVLPDLKKALYHPMDSRTADDSVFADALNLIVPIDKPFRYKWRGKERVFMNPPDRPNDRSIMIPYRESWAS